MKSAEYPVLYELANLVHAVPASEASVERAICTQINFKG